MKTISVCQKISFISDIFPKIRHGVTYDRRVKHRGRSDAGRTHGLTLKLRNGTKGPLISNMGEDGSHSQAGG